MRKWYAAHIVMWVKYKEHEQKSVPIWNNIVLFAADSFDEAFAKAEARGKDEEGDSDGSFTWEGKPARWVFGGVRKVTLCEDGDEERPKDGTELTYLQLRARSQESLCKFVKGEQVSVELIEQFRD
jgi:hypothetical protein